MVGLGVAPPVRDAQAVPSFARQTSLPCNVCHTEFPQLTPFGRQFKLNGYTLSANMTELPPFAVMVEGLPGFTHTQKAQPEEDVPAGFHENNNVSVDQLSLFYAGRLFGPYADQLASESVSDVLDKIGIFAQGTWDGVAGAWAWDNMELRVANATKVNDVPVVVGAYLNNNPTMQDLWNTTPAWGFPFASSPLAPTPGASPLIGGLGQQVVGLGAYTMVDDLVYVEAGAYHRVAAGTQQAFGGDTEGQSKIEDFAPYWRLAVEKSFGEHTIEVGTYGMQSRVLPGGVTDAGHDTIYNEGVDSQYQYLTGEHSFTLMLNWLNQNQQLHASQTLDDALHQHGRLWTATCTGSYLYEHKYGLDVQFFDTQGSRDALLYGTPNGRPGSAGWIFQLNWLPLNAAGGPSFWPYSNVKFSLQYTLYTSFDGATSNFDGAGRDAHDNNTIFLETWIAF
ncbi:MAG TPA: cytochrome C [Myxococcota bacterium]|nr:cytochrome C [Myxococcota bacterium]